MAAADQRAVTGLAFDGSIRRGEFELRARFSVADGEVLGVIGPNGAGKTTLLRALAGLAGLDGGRISLGESVLDDPAAGVLVRPEHRPVGLVFQNYRLFPHLSVLDNVAFAGRSGGLSRRASRQAAERWLERLELTKFAARKPAELSGGQAQRVALARALAAEPALLLLDEPLAALDVRTRTQVRGELARQLAEFAGPALVVTHDPLEALVLTDRLLVIEDGRVVQDAPPAEVASRPATEYVAGLVGLNLYPGVQGERTAVDLDGGGTLWAAESDGSGRPQPAPGSRVLVRIRPSAIALYAGRPGSASPRNVWAGTVRGLELLTDRVRVQVEGSPSALVDLTPAAVAELRLVAGSPVWLSVKATEVGSYPDPSRL